jgi:hypothetical protein
MNLEELQRAVFDVIRQPLTASEGMRQRTQDGRAVQEIVDGIIKPNDRLTSFERLEIYNRVYWFRILSALAEDFPGLRAVIGQKRFDRLLTAYLTQRPSVSFTLRDLGSRLEAWLREHPEFTPKTERLALDMVRLEWADIEAYDAAELPKLSEQDLRHQGEDPHFHLQPYLKLLDLAYPVDDFLLSIRRAEGDEGDQDSDIVSNVVLMHTPQAEEKQLPLPLRKKTYLAVHRQDDIVYFKRLDPEGFTVLRALQDGKSLSQAIEAALPWSKRPEAVAEKLHDWFANWSSLGWFCQPPRGED